MYFAAGNIVQEHLFSAAEHTLRKQQSRAKRLSLKLGDQVLTGDQPGHGDLLPEEVIPDRIHMNRAVREFPADGIYMAFDKRSSQQPCGDGYLFFPAVSLQCSKRGLHLFFQQSQHSNTVFQLNVPVIPLFLRQRTACENIELVAGMDKMSSMLFIKLFLPPLDQINGFNGLLFPDWL